MLSLNFLLFLSVEASLVLLMSSTTPHLKNVALSSHIEFANKDTYKYKVKGALQNLNILRITKLVIHFHFLV